MKQATILRFLTAAASALALMAASPAQAVVSHLDVDVTGTPSSGSNGSVLNTVLSFQIGALSHVTALEWSVQLSAYDPSWLSEMQVDITSSDGLAGVAALRPGAGRNTPGSAIFNDSVDLSAYGLDFKVGSDGLLLLRFSESYDDPEVRPNGLWSAGTLRVSYEAAAAVPEPASAALMALGLGGLLVLQRRRGRAYSLK